MVQGGLNINPGLNEERPVIHHSQGEEIQITLLNQSVYLHSDKMALTDLASLAINILNELNKNHIE